MSMTGKWCFKCGSEAGLVPLPTIPVGTEIKPEVCDGCGKEKLAVPAYHFKISVAAARRAAEKRNRDEPSTLEKEHERSNCKGSTGKFRMA